MALARPNWLLMVPPHVSGKFYICRTFGPVIPKVIPSKRDRHKPWHRNPIRSRPTNLFDQVSHWLS